jgi:hypothetical protein
VNQAPGKGLRRIIRAEGVLGDSKLLKTPAGFEQVRRPSFYQRVELGGTPYFVHYD